MAKAFLDTTILADALLKPGEVEAKTKVALRKYTTTELPVYAIKELKAGVLKNYIWFYNKFALFKSFGKAMKALHGMALTPRKYTTASALEAFAAAAFMMRNSTTTDMVAKYGPTAKDDVVMCDRYRLALRKIIESGWRRRRRITTHVVIPLPCYPETAPYEAKGLLEWRPVECNPQPECCLAANLKKRTIELQKLKKAIEALPFKPENRRRLKVLNELIRNPKRPMTAEMCRDLGDAFFALFCPNDAVILTTNVQDHEPLATIMYPVFWTTE